MQLQSHLGQNTKAFVLMKCEIKEHIYIDTDIDMDIDIDM